MFFYLFYLNLLASRVFVYDLPDAINMFLQTMMVNDHMILFKGDQFLGSLAFGDCLNRIDESDYNFGNHYTCLKEGLKI